MPAAASPQLEDSWSWFGSATPRLRLGGHSNAGAFAAALASLPVELAANVAVLFGAVAPTSDRYWSLLQEGDGVVAIVWGGHEHLHQFLFDPTQLVVVAPGQRARTDVRGPVISYRMLDELWRASMHDLRGVLDGFRDPSQVIVIGTHPPSPERLVRAALELPAVAEAWGSLVATGVTPSTAPLCDIGTLVAMWRSLQQAQERTARASGASFLAVPDWALTADWTLREEFAEYDAMHANSEYGLRMWSEVFRHLGWGVE